LREFMSKEHSPTNGYSKRSLFVETLIEGMKFGVSSVITIS